MLTRDSIDAAYKQQASYGEGRHRFGKGHERLAPVPRDADAKPKASEGKPEY